MATTTTHTDRFTAIAAQAAARAVAILNRPRSPAEEAKAQIACAKAALKKSAELRRYNTRCFPGVFGRDFGPAQKASALTLATCAMRRHRAAELRASIPSTTQQKAA